MGRELVLLVAAVAVSFRASAQPAAVQLSMSDTLREALERSGFADGIRTNDGPDLDRKLTSSEFGVSADAFAAGYYFRDELDGQALGPLHVSLFDRTRRLWVHQHSIRADAERRGLQVGGSVFRVLVTPNNVLLDTHATPSAGFTIVLDRSLRIITSIGGYGSQTTDKGMFWCFGNMVHFADIHQETLKAYDLNRRAEGEIFPGTTLSGLAERYRREIRRIYATLAGDQHVADFDRSIEGVEQRNSIAFAFVVRYRSDYLSAMNVAHPTLTTIARCDRRSIEKWVCSEREFDGAYDKQTLETRVAAALAGR